MPVMASTRRMPAATPLSEIILNKPISPVASTCVPPHNSHEVPISSTRTSVSYFSPNKATAPSSIARSEEHTSELQSRGHLVCRLLLEKKKHNNHTQQH